MKKFFETLNSYYWRDIQADQKQLNLSDRVQELQHFCHYAFERAGSPTAYHLAAIKATKAISTPDKNRDQLNNRAAGY